MRPTWFSGTDDSKVSTTTILLIFPSVFFHHGIQIRKQREELVRLTHNVPPIRDSRCFTRCTPQSVQNNASTTIISRNIGIRSRALIVVAAVGFVSQFVSFLCFVFFSSYSRSSTVSFSWFLYTQIIITKERTFKQNVQMQFSLRLSAEQGRRHSDRQKNETILIYFIFIQLSALSVSGILLKCVCLYFFFSTSRIALGFASCQRPPLSSCHLVGLELPIPPREFLSIFLRETVGEAIPL